MAAIDTSAAAFLAGLVTSLHCVGMCGPLSCSWALGSTAGAPVRRHSFAINTALYHGARLTSYGIIGPWSLGATQVELDAGFSSDRWYETMEKHRVSVWYTAPTAIRMLMKDGVEPPKRHAGDAAMD